MPGLEARDKQFFLDGKPFTILSGAVHYFRVVPEYWKDRLIRVKAAGLNSVETYVPWNLHEEVRGEFNFEGILNLRRFVELAHELGLYVIFRPGPYICSEWDYGGLPSWLLHDPHMKVRSSYQPYLDAVDKFFERLFAEIVDLQYARGGPIIAVQIENEYGSYGDDSKYKTFLKENMEQHGITELFFTSDNGSGIQKGNIPGVLHTANFQHKDHAYLIFGYLKNIKQPDMPLMVTEFWTGWFDHWGDKHAKWPAKEFEELLKFVLEQKSSVNFYMFHGGTNFGFMNGANEGLGATNEGGGEPYAPDVTSYDYDAPVAENGDLQPKFFKIKELLLKYCKDSIPKDVPDIPPPIESCSYDSVRVTHHMTFEDLLTFIKPDHSIDPIPMENLYINNGGGQSFGFTCYRKTVGQSGNLRFTGRIRDRAVILNNGEETHVVDWKKTNPTVMVGEQSDEGFLLDILVENTGRVNYSDFNSPMLNDQRKGLVGPVSLDGRNLQDWQIFPLEFKKDFINSVQKSDKWVEGLPSKKSPALYKLNLKLDTTPKDTYVNMLGWTKGIVFVNGFNLGRYWEIGPQKTLFLPAPLLKEGDNELLIFELHSPHEELNFDSKPELGPTIVHATVLPMWANMSIGALKAVLRLGGWVWKPLRLVLRS